MTGDGTYNEQKRVMKEKGLGYAMAIRNSTLQRGECIMAYGAYYLPSLVYVTPATTLSYKECEDVLMIFIEQDLIPKEDKGAYNHV
jgi:hypothetical protein